MNGAINACFIWTEIRSREVLSLLLWLWCGIWRKPLLTHHNASHVCEMLDITLYSISKSQFSRKYGEKNICIKINTNTVGSIFLSSTNEFRHMCSSTEVRVPITQAAKRQSRGWNVKAGANRLAAKRPGAYYPGSVMSSWWNVQSWGPNV